MPASTSESSENAPQTDERNRGIPALTQDQLRELARKLYEKLQRELQLERDRYRR
jgi:hypothetical protein